VFTSVKDLNAKIRAYIDGWNDRFFESVFADHSKDHPVAVTYVGSDTLTGTRTPLCWTSFALVRRFSLSNVSRAWARVGTQTAKEAVSLMFRSFRRTSLSLRVRSGRPFFVLQSLSPIVAYMVHSFEA
jgi:hypothetical protein